MGSPPPLGRPGEPYEDSADPPVPPQDQPLSIPDPWAKEGDPLSPDGLRVRPPRPVRAAAARLVVTEQVVHVSGRGEPSPWQSRFSRPLATAEQPYRREFAAGPEWRPLDCGWLKAGASQLLLHNLEGTARLTYPTEAEKAADAARVVEVCLASSKLERGYWEPFAFVRPGLSCRLEPGNLDLFRVRCPGGTARCTLVLTPE